MAGLKGHFDSDTAAPPPPYSAQPNAYGTSPYAYQGPPPQQQGYNYQTPQPNAYYDPNAQTQSASPAYPPPGGRSPYLQPQNGPQYASGPDTKYSPHPSPQLSGNSPRLQPQQSPNLVPQLSPQYPSNPQINMTKPAMTQPRTLHVYHTSSSQGTISDSDKATTLYTYRTHSWSKPHLELHSTALNNAVIGTITFHSWSSNIDLTLHNQPLTLSSMGWMQSGHKFVTRAGAPGVQGELRWKTPGVMSADQVLLDQRDQVLARWENSNWAISKEGRLVLQGASAVAGPLMDEVVLTRLAEMMYRKRKSAAANGGAAASGGAGGGA